MKYRGQECSESRPFSDATGTGTEWRFPAATATGKPWPVGKEWCSREHATRVVPAQEASAKAVVVSALKSATDTDYEKAAVIAIQKAAIPKVTLDAKIAELKAAGPPPVGGSVAPGDGKLVVK